MDAGDLRVFEAVARLGGMNRAAAELHTVQSNVTSRIRLLEAEIGTPLFHRHSRGVVLTPAGTRLLPYAARTRALLAEALQAARDDGQPKGPLVVGSLETTAAVRLSPVLAAYAAAFPEVDLALRTGTTRELIESVLDHRLEGAFVCGPVDHPELVEEPILSEELVVVGRPAIGSLEQALGGGAVNLLVLRVGCSYRQRFEEVLARRGVVVARRLEFGTLDAILGCVGGGLGITLLPRSLVERARDDGRVALHALPPAEARVDTVFVRRRDGFVSSALTAFLRFSRPEAVQAAAE
ncbi:MAG: LysR family transcriptional regulator [Alphaproteobacteria bacterium]|nr:LysR family transcriptional regulator [Alphaproteobacteria bacterium]